MKLTNMPELRDILYDKKIIDFTPEEMVEAGFEGDGVPESVRELIQEIREDPECMGFMTGFMLYCTQSTVLKHGTKALDLSAQPSDASEPYGEVSVAPDALTPVGSNIMTPFEMANYYHGVFKNPNNLPQLYYRSNMAEAPFPLPKAGDRRFKVPIKSIVPAYDKVLTRQLWAVIAPKVIAVLKQRGIRYSAVKMAQFSTTPDEATVKPVLGPYVVWIGTQPGTTSPAQAQEASPEIVGIFEHHGVPGVVAEWYESTIQKLVDVRIRDPVSETNPVT